MKLAGCGAGSATANAASYTLQSAFDHYLDANHSYIVQAAINLDVSLTLSGTATETELSAQSELDPSTFGSATPVSVFTFSATAGVSGPYVTKYYFNEAKQLLGIDFTASVIPDFGFSVVSGTPQALPTSAKIGDTGRLGTTTTYVDSTKETTLGTGELTWRVVAGTTSDKVILEILNTQAIPGADVANTLLRYEIGSDNVVTLVRQSAEITAQGNTYSGVLTLSAPPP
jgi:hypothetical protein